MHDAARDEDKRSFFALDRLVAQHERGFALEDVEELVLVVVDVRRRARARCTDLLDEAEGATRLLTCRLERHEVTQHPDRCPLVSIQRDLVRHGLLSFCAEAPAIVASTATATMSAACCVSSPLFANARQT